MARHIYTVHARGWSPASDADAVFIKEGFSWPAFVFGPIWALWFGMWKTAIFLLVLSIVVSGMLVVLGITEAGELAVTLAFQAAMGFWGNDWRRYALARRDYAERGVVSGRKLADAERHYFAGMS